MRAEDHLRRLRDVLEGRAEPPPSYDLAAPLPAPREAPPPRPTRRGALPPYDGVFVPLPTPTADNCRCWKCWLCPCICPPGQGLRGPIPPEMRADAAPAPRRNRCAACGLGLFVCGCCQGLWCGGCGAHQVAPREDALCALYATVAGARVLPRDPEQVLPGRFDGRWGAPQQGDHHADRHDRPDLAQDRADAPERPAPREDAGQDGDAADPGPRAAARTAAHPAPGAELQEVREAGAQPADLQLVAAWAPPLPERCHGGCGTAQRFLSFGGWCTHHWRLVPDQHRQALAAASDPTTYARALAAARTAVAAEARRRWPRGGIAA